MCSNKENMKELLKLIVEGGGEGAIARLRGSVYEHSRSRNLIKLKVYLLLARFVYPLYLFR